MRINPIYNVTSIKQKKQPHNISPNFTAINHSTLEMAIHTPAEVIKAKYLNVARSVNNPSFEEWAQGLVENGEKIGEKYIKYLFGYTLAESLYQNLYKTKRDYSDEIFVIREELVNSDFVASAQPSDRTKDSLPISNRYVMNNLKSIISAIDILGLDTVLTAIKLKQNRFETLINDVRQYKDDTFNFCLDLLKQKTNPVESEEYARLKRKQNMITGAMKAPIYEEFFAQHEINNAEIEKLQEQLKAFKLDFSEENKKEIKNIHTKIKEIRKKDFDAKPESLIEHDKKMTWIKGQINKLLASSIKDPMKKIEVFYLHKLIGENDYEKLLHLNSIISEGNDAIKKYLSKRVVYSLNLSEEELQKFYELGIQDSYYFPKIFQADFNVRFNIKDLLRTLCADKNIDTALDSLRQNQKTRELFEFEGYDYDAWSKFDESRDVIQIDENTQIRKVDMNNIKHSLFLGNQAGCCTAIGTGLRSRFAPNYIKNKFVQAIELVVNGDSVGNTMCYIAKISGKYNALILDNIELLAPYRYNPVNIDYFVNMGKKLLENIGAKDVPIYAGTRQPFKVGTFSDSCLFSNVKFLGDSGVDEINLDSVTMSLMNELVSPTASYSAAYFTCILPHQLKNS